MTDMTPAPRELIADYWDLAYAEGAESRSHDTPAGDAMRVSAEIDKCIAALLQQLAERDAEVERLRIELEVSNTACGEYASQAMQASFRAQEAERAREEATGLLRRVNASLYLLDKPHREFGGVTDKTATDIAAFLAASGGGRED